MKHFNLSNKEGKTVFLLRSHYPTFSSVQSLSRVRLFATPWTAARQGSLSITNFRSLLRLMSIESVMPSNHLILCRPLLLRLLSFPASGSFVTSHFVPRFQSSSVQSLNCVRLFVTPWTAAHQASLSITNFRSLLRLMSIELVMPSNHLILCRPHLLLPSIFPSIRVFSNESIHIRWPKYWSFSVSISLTNEYSGLISFRINWFDLALQGTVKSLR